MSVPEKFAGNFVIVALVIIALEYTQRARMYAGQFGELVIAQASAVSVLNQPVAHIININRLSIRVYHSLAPSLRNQSTMRRFTRSRAEKIS